MTSRSSLSSAINLRGSMQKLLGEPSRKLGTGPPERKMRRHRLVGWCGHAPLHEYGALGRIDEFAILIGAGDMRDHQSEFGPAACAQFANLRRVGDAITHIDRLEPAQVAHPW